MRKPVITALLGPFVALWPVLAHAASPKLFDASILNDDRSHVHITFDGGVEQAKVDKGDYWLVLLITKTDVLQPAVTAVTITGCVGDVAPRATGPCPAGDSVVTLQLSIAAPAPPALASIEIVYRGPLGPTSKTFKTAETAQGAVAGAKKDDADISFSGSYAWTANGGGAKYNIDTFAGYMWQRTDALHLGAYGQAKTKDSPSADPQSFLLYGASRYVFGSGEFKGPFQVPFIDGLAGLELNKKGQQQNAVVSPRIAVPFRASRGRLGPIEPGFTTPNGTIQAGIEFVKPLESALADRSLRYRGLFGTTFTAGLKRGKPWFYGVTFKGLYEVRLLSADEPFMDPRHAPFDPVKGKKGDTPLEFGSQPRHHAEASAGYLLAEWAGFEVKYEYGGLPPAFVLADHTLSFSVTLTLKQTSYGRSAILKP